MTPVLKQVIRLDSLPLNQTFFTKEGYLIDRPILTSTGIFEYQNPDGSIRRELRLPEDVFEAESLKSYKGRPIIITHDAGLISSENVREHQIGTILTEGYRSNNDVRAEIIIHDTDGMKESGLKELSLGYNLDLDETPGEWEGQHYDAVQRNIRINHLALVREARAGEQARLNIDSRDPEKTLKGGRPMSKTNDPKATENAHRTDGTLTPEEFAKAIEEYKARRAKRMSAKADSATESVEESAVVDEPDTVAEDGKEAETTEEVVKTPEEQLQFVKDRKDRRDSEEDPENMDAAKSVIAQQDEDIGILFDIIDTLLANAEANKDCDDVAKDSAEEPAEENTDGNDGEEEKPEEVAEDGKCAEDCDNTDGEDCDKTDEDDDPTPSTNASEIEKTVLNVDSVDDIVRQRIQLGMIGRDLNMDGLENMSIMDAKKAVVKAVRPAINLDGKDSAYVDAAFDYAVDDIKAKSENSTVYQMRQMFNKDSKKDAEDEGQSAADHRQRMIDRQMKKKEDK